jgi:hypothetical protein
MEIATRFGSDGVSAPSCEIQMSTSVEQINSLYRFSEKSKITVVEINSEVVERYCEIHSFFRRAAQKNEGDPLMESFLRLSGTFRFRILSTPLSLNNALLLDDDGRRHLLERAQEIGESYGELHSATELFASTLEIVRSSKENPMWHGIKKQIASQSGKNIAFVIKPARLAMPVQDELASNGFQITVVNENQLRHASTYDALYFFGAGRWYPGFSFSAPRAPSIQIVRYSLLNDGPPDEATFVKPFKTTHSNSIAIKSEPKPADFFGVEPDEVLPKLDLSSILNHRALHGDKRHLDQGGELIEAIALLLDQELAVFIPSSDGATEQVVDIREDAEKILHRVPTAELQPGMAVLVRTEGGGDYIVAAADRIMSNEADELRQRQRNWKRQLRQAVNDLGIADAVTYLLESGSKIASPQNIRNWMSFRSIRTLHKAEFEAIFRLIGAEGSVDEYWEAMGVIDAAHRHAGMLIRRRLLEQVKSTDLSALQRDGRQDFALPGEVGGGNLTAARIVAISSEILEVHPSKIHQLIELDA